MPQTSTAIVSVRMSGDERALLDQAARQTQTKLSDFIRRKALEAAEVAILERSEVVVPASAWEQIEAWVAAPIAPSPALERLAASKPLWEA